MRVERSEAGTFTLQQELAVGAGPRADFAEAVRLLEGEQYGPAIGLLEGVTERVPEAVAAHIDLGIAYARSGDLERAERSLKRAIEIEPRHPVAHNELGIVQRRTGRFDEARRSYESALAVHPDFHFAHRNLAILCDLYLADAGCALEHYARYSEAVPDDREVEMWVVDLRNREAR